MMPPITEGTAETSLTERWRTELLPLWQNFVHGHLHSHDQTRLNYSYYLAASTAQAVVFSSGRVEMAVKYIELMQQFISAGYSVFILDHRGQGMSARFTTDPHLGYVTDFQHYVTDFQQFMTEIVKPFGHQQHLLLAHSMGAAIACRYLQQYRHPFAAAIFGSPMFGINTGRVPATLANRLVTGFDWLRTQLGQTNQTYFPGQTTYLAKPFAGNPLTQSQAHYQWLQQLYQQYPDSQLGGVSWAWLIQAIVATAHIQRDAATFTLPVLLLQAEADTIVSNRAQNRWFNQLPALLYKRKILIAGARHEIWMEQDSIRQQALAAVNAFLAGLSTPPTALS